MSKTIASDEKNDIYLARDGNLAVVVNLDSVVQSCAHAAKAQLGEMVLAQLQGVPNFQTIWQNAVNVPQFEAYLRRVIMAVDGVTGIDELDVGIRDNTVFYTATIQTIYGSEVLNG